MASFSVDGKEYPLRLTFAVRQRILDTTKIDLANDFEKVGTLPQSDLTGFVNVVYQWIKPEFGGDEQAFAALVDGDVLEAAHEAVLEAVIDFFPGEKRPTLRTIKTKSKELDRELAATALKVMDKEKAALIEKLNEASIESLTTWLGSLASKTSAPSPSAP